MAEIRSGRGLVDTSVLIDLEEARCLPTDGAISALSLAELAAGPHAAVGGVERSRRLLRIHATEAAFDMLPFDRDCARAYGSVFAAVQESGRKPRGRRAVDMMIAATALAHDLPLYTFNARDLDGLEPLLEVVDAGSAPR